MGAESFPNNGEPCCIRVSKESLLLLLPLFPEDCITAAIDMIGREYKQGSNINGRNNSSKKKEAH